MSVTLLTAAKCPMGCGGTLEVNDLGTLRCFAQDCPRPDAAELVLSSTETEHLVAVEEHGYTLQHPLRERLEGHLFACRVHAWVSDTVADHQDLPGTYRVEVGADGDLYWEFLGGRDAQL
jgi:hypothetical protein